MKVAIIGAHPMEVPHLASRLPKETTKILTIGQEPLHSHAKKLAKERGYLYDIIPLDSTKEVLFHQYATIFDEAQYILALWDGNHEGTALCIQSCAKEGKPCKVIPILGNF